MKRTRTFPLLALALAAFQITLASFCALRTAHAEESNAQADAQPNAQGELTVTITGLHSREGNVVVALYSDSAAFPRDPSKAVAIQSIPARVENPVLIFKDLPPGNYAVALHHDEDADGKMSFNFLGMPKEGFGFSKNRAVLFGPPSFNGAKLEVQDAHAACEVIVKYF